MTSFVEQIADRCERAAYELRHPYLPGHRAAQLRAFWNAVVLGYDSEICQECGRKVGASTGSWWHAPGDLWQRVHGRFGGILCPPCFTAAARAKGIRLHWQPHTEDQAFDQQGPA